ncbi:leucine-rich repeat-containing protein 15-like [Harmonia axyridis]|uniref:leucine-rich repeat-containing protein 15-like n=1 Tax=Harmonia axyridis TaxID=115357 RepID=UPI001E27604F|nr:leucine-rich repeat-containing protein 15-like [Harmonia axyridis]
MHTLAIPALLISLLLPLTVFCENCEKPYNVEILVSDDVNGDIKNLTAQGAITLHQDVFQVLVANQTIKKLCQNYVIINNELTVLQLLNNSIEDISPSAFNISATLALLKISENPLNTIKKGVFNEVRTKELDLSYNNIAVIEADALENNTYLEIIKLNHNFIKEFDPNWFTKTPNVYKISAIYNEMTKIPAYAFVNMTKSRPLKIRLSANRIEEIDPMALEGAGIIDMLKLGGNRIRELPGQLFVNKTIKSLQVDTNKLQCFPEEFFNSTLTELTFEDNTSFDCACLIRVKNFVEDRNVTVVYPAIICEDKSKGVQIVFNKDKTFKIPIIKPSTV